MPDLDELTKDPRYWDGDHPEHEDVVRQVSEMFERKQAEKSPSAKEREASKAWLDAIAEAEKPGVGQGGWDVRHDDEFGFALGRYQMRKPALQDTGFIDKDGKWTGKLGVRSPDDFLKNRAAQDAALREYSGKLDGYIKDNSLDSRVGQSIKGVKADIQVSPSGLAAAAHRRGAGRVKEYFEWLDKNGGNSRDHVAEMPDRFKQIETRLRVFQKVPYKQ